MRIYPSLKAGYKAIIPTCHIMVNLINNSVGFVTVTVAINICANFIQIISNWTYYILIIIAWAIWFVSTLNNIKSIEESTFGKGVIFIYIFIYTAFMVAAGLITLSL